MDSSKARSAVSGIILCSILILAGIALRIFHDGIQSIFLIAIIAGLAIFAASFMLSWACDAAQSYIPQSIALAIVAFIAVLPEYAVDMYITWMAGQEFLLGIPDAESHYAPLAVANMTGANRLIIGVAWVLIIVIAYFKTKGAILLEKERRMELFFLMLASIYALVVVLKGSLNLIDTVVFIGIYAWYIILASKRPIVEMELEGGPSELIGSLEKPKKIAVTLVIFLFSAAAIFACAEPFSESLIAIGKMQSIVPEFYVIQWLAPLASEAPEFIIATIFAVRGLSSMALGSLLSAKLNQWTLLVGMIPLVYAISTRQIMDPIHMGSFQMHEILITAAQSILAVFILARYRVNIWHGALLFFLFIGQLITPVILKNVDAFSHLMEYAHIEHASQVFTILYFLTAVFFIVKYPRRLGVFNYKKVLRGE